MAHNKGFSKQKSDIRDIGNICEQAGHNSGSWVEFITLRLVDAKLSSQILTIVRKKIEF